MSGIKNIKKKLKGFQVRPPNAEVIKKVLLHIPYVVVFYVVNKCTWLYQYCRGSTVVDRLMVLLMNYPLAFKKLLPSIQPKSLAAGTIAAVSVWAVVYFKGKNGKKFRKGEEYGSARWGNEKDIAPFIDPVFENNILLTQTERLTMNSRPKKPKYARNKNVIVIGGSGSGKTRFYVKPQLMQMPDNVSFVVTDPKGTIIVECGKMLARGTPKKDKNGKILRDKNGRVVMAPYKIKVLNTINFAKSMHYNPFHYIRSEKDILKLVNTIMVNTKGEGEKSSEDFWTKAERLLYCALIGYIYYEAPEEEQNFSTLLEFINASETREEDEEFKNAVDLLFEELERDEPNHFAVRESAEFAPFLNIMNEWYVRDTSRKITTVLKARGMSGKAHTTNRCCYGYKKSAENPDKWVIDEEAAEVVRRIFNMCLNGKGPYASNIFFAKNPITCGSL